MMVRIGLVGLGENWPTRERPALKTLADGFEIRAICDPVAARAQQAAEEFGASLVRGYHALARREDLDALLVLDSGWFGPLPVLAACNAKKAVYWGTGWENWPEKIETVCRRVNEAGIVLTVGLKRRHAPASLRLQELIATRLGRPKTIFAHRRIPQNKPPEPHQPKKIDPFRRELVEMIDWCCFIMDRSPSRVTGIGHWDEAHGTDEADYRFRSLSLEFSEPEQDAKSPSETPPASAQIICEKAMPRDWEESDSYRRAPDLRVVCENGVAFVDLPTNLVWFDRSGHHQESLESERPIEERILTHFHRLVTGATCRAANLDDACRALKVVEKATLSYRQGTRIEW